MTALDYLLIGVILLAVAFAWADRRGSDGLALGIVLTQTVLWLAEAIFFLIRREWGNCALSGACVLIGILVTLSLLRRLRRRRGPRALGEKSRALRDRLVRTMREAAPRPVIPGVPA